MELVVADSLKDCAILGWDVLEVNRCTRTYDLESKNYLWRWTMWHHSLQ